MEGENHENLSHESQWLGLGTNFPTPEHKSIASPLQQYALYLSL
jgi:hypothetical protein